MIQNEFKHIEGPVAKAPRKRDAALVVESLGHRVGELSLGAEVVEEQFLVGAQHPGYPAHGLYARAQGAGCPLFEEGGGPCLAAVFPELPETLLEFPGARGAAQHAQNGLELGAGMPPDPAATFEQQEAATLELLPGILPLDAALLAAPDLVHGGVEMLDYMEWVEHVECHACFLGDDFQVGLPHVGTHHLKPGQEPGAFAFQFIESGSDGFFRAFPADPEQAAGALVDLVNQGDEVVAFLALAPMKFINAQRRDVRQVAVFQSPIDHPLHRAAHRFPTATEDLCGFLPREAPPPLCQEKHVGLGVGTLAGVPVHVLDEDPV